MISAYLGVGAVALWCLFAAWWMRDFEDPGASYAFFGVFVGCVAMLVFFGLGMI